MLTALNINQYYSGSHILRNLSLQARAGEARALPEGVPTYLRTETE